MVRTRNRATRRAATQRVCRRRFIRYRAQFERDDFEVICGPGHFKTRRPWQCGCARHRKGRPRLGKGLCSIGLRDRIYRLRADGRALREAVRAGAFDVAEADALTLDNAVFNRLA